MATSLSFSRKQANEIGVTPPERAEVETALAHLVVAEALPRATIINLVEVRIGNHYEPHPVPMRIIKGLSHRALFVSSSLKKWLHLNHEPRLVAPIMHSDVVVLVLAVNPRSLVPEDVKEKLSDKLSFLLLSPTSEISDQRNVILWNLHRLSDKR